MRSEKEEERRETRKNEQRKGGARKEGSKDEEGKRSKTERMTPLMQNLTLLYEAHVAEIFQLLGQ